MAFRFDYTMAVIGDEINDELNFILKSLAERGKKRPLYAERDEYFLRVFVQLWSSFLNEITENQISVRLYGSTAEDLKCIEGYDLGDMDIIIFPNSDNLMISEELLEYSLENPLHVRIKGGQHPVLQSCLVEGTKYVATTALKNFHHKIFGFLSPALFENFTFFFEALSAQELLNKVVTPLKSNETSPAVTFNLASLFPLKLSVELMETVANWFCLLNGMFYTRQHAEILDKLILLLKNTEPAVDPISICYQILSCFSHFLGPNNFDELRLRDILGLPQNKAVHNNYKQSVTPEKNHESQSERSSNVWQNVTVTPHCVDVDNKILEDLEPIFCHSAMPGNSVEKSFQLSGKLATSTKSTQSEAGKQNNGDCNDGTERKLTETKRRPRGQKGRMTSDDLPNNLENNEDDIKAEMKKVELTRRVTIRFLKHLLGVGNNTKGAKAQETKFKETERLKMGFDVIPALRSGGWPTVAKEWIKRERKWPSSGLVEKVVQEGFYLVVKSPKNNGNPECDFRISFSHAEYLLSQEMNDIQRDCYRCLKTYHRTYLCTQPKSLVSFHLKNIFLQTIEETGAEMWNEGNRTECMMKLLENLLKALTKKDLRHFFVRSYNLFGEDYIENSKILQTLAAKVEHFTKSPVQLLKELTQKEEQTVRVAVTNHVPSSEPTVPAKPATRQHETIQEMPSKCNFDTQAKKEKAAVPLLPSKETRDRLPVASYRFHDLKDSYQEVTKELVNVAFDAADCRIALETMDPLERSLVKDLLELRKKYNVNDPVEDFLEVFDDFWFVVTFLRVMCSTEQDLRRRILDAVRGLVEIMKHAWKEGDFADFKTIWSRILVNIFAGNSSYLNHLLPSGFFIQMAFRFPDGASPIEADVIYEADIPLD